MSANIPFLPAYQTNQPVTVAAGANQTVTLPTGPTQVRILNTGGGLVYVRTFNNTNQAGTIANTGDLPISTQSVTFSKPGGHDRISIFSTPGSTVQVMCGVGF